MGFWVFLVHPTVVSVLLSASVERFFVSRMRDFFGIGVTIRIGQKMLCLPYAGFFNRVRPSTNQFCDFFFAILNY